VKALLPFVCCAGVLQSDEKGEGKTSTHCGAFKPPITIALHSEGRKKDCL
jgi:hypothetical protein